MECRKLEITLVSADDLPDIRSLGMMKVYAKLSIKGESKTKKRTPVDREGETNPTWNFTIEYIIGEAAVQKQGLDLLIQLYCKRTFGGRFIGEVSIPIKSLFDEGMRAQAVLSYSVGGTPSGRMNILCSFGEKIVVQKRSGWEKALKFLRLLYGVIVFIRNESGDADESVIPVFTDSRDVKVVPSGDQDGEVFFDVQD
ncbi:hypothetical protein Pfo_021134 [Paulownia fortunei]|nr:hypothetical protein Pfo_021134 [Paulownia fortunei]